MSDSIKHHSVYVHTFQQHVIKFIKYTSESPLKIITVYFSDESAAQNKSRKNLLSITHHYEDSAVPAEWHFFATSHAKSAHDGVGDTLKRLAAKTSLQQPYRPHNDTSPAI
jgi:hypothetical protein